MPFEPFYERFPEVAEKETRTIIAINDPDLPDGEYGLIEAYCNEPNCDCRRVFFNVYWWQKRKVAAVIAYGWESREYYIKWFGNDDPGVIPDLQGPVLNPGSPQSELAPKLLKKIKYVVQDESYVARIKKHYRMFKETVHDRRPVRERPSERISRNAPCPCGSGKKYKRCCGKRV